MPGAVDADGGIAEREGAAWNRRHEAARPRSPTVVGDREARHVDVREDEPAVGPHHGLVRGRVVADQDVIAKSRDRRFALRGELERRRTGEGLEMVQCRVVDLDVEAFLLAPALLSAVRTALGLGLFYADFLSLGLVS